MSQDKPDPPAPRYMFVVSGVILGEPKIDPDRTLWKERPDGTWERAVGKDIVKINDRFPNFIEGWKQLYRDDEDY